VINNPPMLKTRCLIVALLLLNIQVKAQKGFSGFYITSDGEKVNGIFPGFREWKFNPSEVKFEGNAKQPAQLTPDMCKAFTIDGYDTYESMQLNRMTNHNRFFLNYYKAAERDSFEIINAFVRLLYNKDSVKLYVFRDNKRSNFFIKVNDTFTELFFKIVFRYNAKTGIDEIFEDKKYVFQLKSFFASTISNDKKLARYLDHLRYDEGQMISFLKKVQTTKSKK
jgi:hypothetical protein